MDIGAALTWAWAKFKQNAGPLVIVMLVAFVGSLIGGGISFSIRRSTGGGFAALLIASAVGNFVAFLINGIAHLGVYRATLTVADGQQVEPGQMFSSEVFGNYLVAILLYGLMVAVGTFLCFIPGIVVAFLGFFTPLFVLDKGMAPTDAIRASFQVVGQNAGALLVFAIVDIIVYAIGFVACGVGALVTAPVALLAVAFVFRRLTNGVVAPAA